MNLMAKDLTKLQAEMDALAGVKCPDTGCSGGLIETQPHVTEPLRCPSCVAFPGLDPKYDVLRVKCTSCNGKAHPLGWYTLPANRAHEAVGKLMDLDSATFYKHGGQWVCGIATEEFAIEEERKRYGSPWEALIAALCEAEGVTV